MILSVIKHALARVIHFKSFKCSSVCHGLVNQASFVAAGTDLANFLSLFKTLSVSETKNSWICKQCRSWWGGSCWATSSRSILFAFEFESSLWYSLIGLNIFLKFADKNFAVCFLVVKELPPLDKQKQDIYHIVVYSSQKITALVFFNQPFT